MTHDPYTLFVAVGPEVRTFLSCARLAARRGRKCSVSFQFHSALQGTAVGDLYMDDEHTTKYKNQEYNYKQIIFHNNVLSSRCAWGGIDKPVEMLLNYDFNTWAWVVHFCFSDLLILRPGIRNPGLNAW